MADFTKDDAVAFVDSLRLTVANRTGFQWMTARLMALAVYLESIASENASMSAYLDSTHTREDYETWARLNPEGTGDHHAE